MTANFSRFHLVKVGVSVVSSLSGRPWWWPAPGETSTWSRSCCVTAPTLHWGTRTAGTPSTSPAGRAILWSYSTCCLPHRMSGGRRAKQAGHHYTLQVKGHQIHIQKKSDCFISVWWSLRDKSKICFSCYVRNLLCSLSDYNQCSLCSSSSDARLWGGC